MNVNFPGGAWGGAENWPNLLKTDQNYGFPDSPPDLVEKPTKTMDFRISRQIFGKPTKTMDCRMSLKSFEERTEPLGFWVYPESFENRPKL